MSNVRFGATIRLASSFSEHRGPGAEVALIRFQASFGMMGGAAVLVTAGQTISVVLGKNGLPWPASGRAGECEPLCHSSSAEHLVQQITRQGCAFQIRSTGRGVALPGR